MQSRHFMTIKSIFSFIIVIVLSLPLSAFAQPSQIALNAQGIRYYPANGELCITQESLPPEALSLLLSDENTVLSSMKHSGLFLIVFTAQGRQVSLKISPKPTQISAQSMSTLGDGEKTLLLDLLMRDGGFTSAEWMDSSEYAVLSTFSGSAEKNAVGLHTLALSTLYLGRIYSFQTDIVNQAPSQSELNLLLSTAKQTLFLGASGTTASSVEASSSVPSADSVEPPFALTDLPVNVSFENDIYPLTIQPIPHIIGSTVLPLSGTTTPGIFVRSIVNGIGSSRIRADQDGHFSFTMKDLAADAENKIEIIAFETQGPNTSTARFTVTVNWQATPLVISQTTGSVEGDTLFLTGQTLPGSRVQLDRGQNRISNVSVAADGSFSCKVPMRKSGETKFAVLSTASGYRRTTAEGTVTRQPATSTVLSSLQNSIQDIPYETLLHNPGDFSGVSMQYEGTVTALANVSGRPCFLLTTSAEQSFAVFCADLLSMELGQSVHVLGTFSGFSFSLDTPWATGSFPAMELKAIVSDSQ